jgi:DNA segregation ATPase FtsK/SpoIIIE-like protein
MTQVVNFWQAQTTSDEPAAPPWVTLMDRLDDEDELLQAALDVVRDLPTVSASLLQRKLRVSYAKAARLIEQLEAKGVVGPDLGGGQGREVLPIDADQPDDA